MTKVVILHDRIYPHENTIIRRVYYFVAENSSVITDIKRALDRAARQFPPPISPGSPANSCNAAVRDANAAGSAERSNRFQTSIGNAAAFNRAQIGVVGLNTLVAKL